MCRSYSGPTEIVRFESVSFLYPRAVDSLKARKGGEEMYISNSAAFNMRIKVTLFTRPMKGSSETEVISEIKTYPVITVVLVQSNDDFPMGSNPER